MQPLHTQSWQEGVTLSRAPSNPAPTGCSLRPAGRDDSRTRYPSLRSGSRSGSLLLGTNVASWSTLKRGISVPGEPYQLFTVITLGGLYE